MSELTQCNYCSWKEAKKRAKKEGYKIKLKPSKEMPGWLAKVKDGEEIGWYMEMSDHCVC